MHYLTRKDVEISTEKIIKDLGLNVPFVKGQNIPVYNCWHFSTDGDKVDAMFYDEDDFINGMERIKTVMAKFNILILAFCLMDTHVHFVFYGDFDECNRFTHEYIRRTSMAIRFKHGISKALLDVPISHQPIDDDLYLKRAIAYDCNNPVVAGLSYNAYDYPWSSCALYFRPKGLWTSPRWADGEYGVNGKNMIFPGNLVEIRLVESIYRTNKSYRFFMGQSPEEVEARGGVISNLSIPIREMREHKNEMCLALFNTKTVKELSTEKRIRLAKCLRAKYNCSAKQVAKLSGLVYSEVEGMI